MKKILLVLFGVFFLVGCGPIGDPIVFLYEKTNYNLEVGDIEILVPTVTGLKEDPSITYSSSKVDVVTVDNHGVLTAISSGQAIITAKLNNVQGKVCNLVVKVTAKSSLEISIVGDSAIDLEVGDVQTFAITNNMEYTETLIWTSDNETVGTINSDGQFTALAMGVTIIKASIGLVSAEIEITVFEQGMIKEPTYLEINGEDFVLLGETITLFAETDAEIAIDLKWMCNNPLIATVDAEGVVTGVSEGTVVILVSIVGYDSITKTKTINVLAEAPIVIEPTEITLSGPVSVDVGSTISIQAEINPTGAKGTVVWASSNESVATVVDGLVTGVVNGVVNITATLLENGEITCSHEVIVKGVVLPLVSISINGPDSVRIGSKINLEVIANPVGASTDVIWMSLAESLATVNSTTGEVKGKAIGTVTITAISKVNAQKIASKEIEVTPGPSITAEASAESLYVGEMLMVTGIVINSENTNVTYSSSNLLVATVDELTGEVTGVGPGGATIIVTAEVDISLIATIDITVAYAPVISISLTEKTIYVNETVTLVATVKNLENTAVIFSTSDSLIATVNESTGVVKGITVGEVTITATSVEDETLYATSIITVVLAPAITMAPTTATVVAGQTVTIKATVSNSTNTAVSYVSSNTAIATVNASTGVVTGVAAGTATITATATVNSNLKATATITVTPAPTITVAPTTSTLAISATVQLTATVKNTTNTAVTWTSSNVAIATVSATGLVKAIAAGTATITATAAVNTSLKATATITVTPTSYTINYNLNSGAWSWDGTTTTSAAGIDSVSNLPEIFMVDFYQYLKINNFLGSSVVDSTLRKTTWATFSKLLTDPKAIYNNVAPTITMNNVNGYSQFFWDTVNTTNKTATGKFFGTEPYKTKYANLLVHILSLYALRSGAVSPDNYTSITSTDPLDIKKCKSGAGFLLDGFFYGTQSLTGSTNNTAWRALRSKIPTPVLKWNSTGSSSSATTYQIITYTYGQAAQLRAPSRVGYMFDGWYNNSGFTGSAIASIAANVAPAATYYAKWTVAS